MIGRVPQSIIDEEGELVGNYHNQSVELESLQKACNNAAKHYLKTRPNPSTASLKRVREMGIMGIGYHPILGKLASGWISQRLQTILIWS